MWLETVNSRFTKDLAIQNIFTCFFRVYCVDCLVTIMIIIIIVFINVITITSFMLSLFIFS